MKFLKFPLLLLILGLLFTSAIAQEKQEDKIEASTKVLKDFSKMKESIPKELLAITEGIIIVPKLINAGFVVAGKRGKGIAMVKSENGSWSNPVFVTITGGSVGFQAGVQAVDLVLIFKNRETLENIGKGSFTLGGDISVTAGPLGRNSTASTDSKLEAEVYSYSRSKGLFAGISLSGSVLDIDEKSNKAFYGEDVNTRDLFSDGMEDRAPSTIELKKTLEEMYKE